MEVAPSYVLEPRFVKVPIKALRESARRKISYYLDDENNIAFNDTGLLCDWHGLAELVGFNRHEMAKIGRAKSPTQELFIDWEIRDSSAVIGNFWDFMLQLERPDVLLDCRIIIERDAKNYLDSKMKQSDDYQQLQDDTISSSADHYIDERALLTIHDTPGCPTLYDVFMCYNADASGHVSDFVNECIRNLEQNHGLKLCIPSRDCLLGAAKYNMDAELIKARCKRMMVVISHEFFNSTACDFQVKFAHSLAPGARKKRLIPVLIDSNLPVPDLLKHITICDFTKPDLLEWFWDRLASSIKEPIDDESKFDGHLSRSRSQLRLSSDSNASVDSNSSSHRIAGKESLNPDYSADRRKSAKTLHTYESFNFTNKAKEPQRTKTGNVLFRLKNFVRSKRHVEY